MRAAACVCTHCTCHRQAISAHFLWLGHLCETWEVVGRLRDGRTDAARALYSRLLAASLHDPAMLSHHPAAVGAYFRLLTLGLRFGRGCAGAAALRSGRAGRDVLLLFDHVLRAVSLLLRMPLCCMAAVLHSACLWRHWQSCAVQGATACMPTPCTCLHLPCVPAATPCIQGLLWFRSPPRYFGRLTRQAAAEQVAALEAFAAELTAVRAIMLRGGGGGAGWPSYNAAAVPVPAAAAGDAGV